MSGWCVALCFVFRASCIGVFVRGVGGEEWLSGVEVGPAIFTCYIHSVRWCFWLGLHRGGHLRILPCAFVLR